MWRILEGPLLADSVEKLSFPRCSLSPQKKRPSQSLCIERSSSREYQTDPKKQAENSVFEFFNRIGCLLPVKYERSLCPLYAFWQTLLS